MPRAHELNGNVDRADNRKRRFIMKRALEQRKQGIPPSLERQLAEFEYKNSERRLVIYFPFAGLCPNPSHMPLLKADNEVNRKPEPNKDNDCVNLFPLQQLLFLQVDHPREVEKICSDCNTNSVSLLKDSQGKVGSSVRDMSAMSSDFLVDSCALMGNSITRSCKKKGKKKGKQQKKPQSRKLSGEFHVQCMEQISSLHPPENTECEASTSSCYNSPSMVLEDTSSPSSSAIENFEEAFDCGECNAGHNFSVASECSRQCNSGSSKSEPGVDFVSERCGGSRANCTGNDSISCQALRTASSSTTTVTKKNTYNIDTNNDHVSSCSISSDNCADVFLDLSVDDWSGDVSGNCSEDTDRGSRERSKSASSLLDSATSEDYKQIVDADASEQSKDCDVDSACCSGSVSKASSEINLLECKQSDGVADDEFHLVSGKKARRRKKMQLKWEVHEKDKSFGMDPYATRSDSGSLLPQNILKHEVKDDSLCQGSCNLSLHRGSISETSNSKVSPNYVEKSEKIITEKALKCSGSVKAAAYYPSAKRHDFSLKNTLSMYMDTSKIKKAKVRPQVSKGVPQIFVDGYNSANSSAAGANVAVGSHVVLPVSNPSQSDCGSSSCDGTMSQESLFLAYDDADYPLSQVGQKGIQFELSKVSLVKCCDLDIGTACSDTSRSTEDILESFSENGTHENCVQGSCDTDCNTASSLTHSSADMVIYSIPASCSDLSVAKNSKGNNKFMRQVRRADSVSCLPTPYDSNLGVCVPEPHLDKINKAVNDVYLSASAFEGINLFTGNPIANIETFMSAVSPVVSDCLRTCKSCSQEQLNSHCSSCCSASDLSLQTIWEWYEEPGCYGLEVKTTECANQGWQHGVQSESSAYFVPYLSAVQLFARCRNSYEPCSDAKPVHAMASNLQSSVPLPLTCSHDDKGFLAHLSVKNHGELIFEYFESDQPSCRGPLFDKIKQLISGAQPAGSHVYGDPRYLQDAKLHDLHSASWFSVAWYPIYRIPQGNFRASFLTYHSVGVRSRRAGTFDITSGLFAFPVVGLLNYNDKGEEWFKLRESIPKSLPSEDAKELRSKLLEQRIRKLKESALTMSKAVIRRGEERSQIWHPDYEFFSSRSR